MKELLPDVYGQVTDVEKKRARANVDPSIMRGMSKQI